jgi:hypothetical protein
MDDFIRNHGRSSFKRKINRSYEKQKRTQNIIPKFDQWYDFDAITKNLDLDTYRRGNGEVM